MIEVADTARWPSAVLLGAQHTAASWLRRVLADRDDVFSPAAEATFLTGRSGSLLDYRERFAGWSGERVCLDAGSVYLTHRARPALVANRLAGAFPEIRLVAVVRDPVARAAQAFAAHRRRGRIDPSKTFGQHLRTIDHALDPLEVVAAGRYGELLGPYLDVHGERVHVIVEEDLFRSPTRCWRDLCWFLGCEGAREDPPLEVARLFGSSRGPWDQKDVVVDEHDASVCAQLLADDAERLGGLLGRALPWVPAAARTTDAPRVVID